MQSVWPKIIIISHQRPTFNVPPNTASFHFTLWPLPSGLIPWFIYNCHIRAVLPKPHPIPSYQSIFCGGWMAPTLHPLTLLIPLLHHLFWKMQKLISKSSFVHCNPSNPPCVYSCLPSYYAISSPDAASSLENSPSSHSSSHPRHFCKRRRGLWCFLDDNRPNYRPGRVLHEKASPSLISQAAVKASPSIHPFCHCLPRCYWIFLPNHLKTSPTSEWAPILFVFLSTRKRMIVCIFLYCLGVTELL